MNLRLANGKVPIYVGGETPYIFLDFPSLEDFCNLYNNYTSKEKRILYWHIISERVKGKTLSDSAKDFGVTRERVRQIEAKFLRLITSHYFLKLNA